MKILTVSVWALILTWLLSLASTPAFSQQAPVGPDLVPHPLQLPEAPPGAQVPTPAPAPTTTQSAPVEPKPHGKGESQLYGVVSDQSGAVLPGARISVAGPSGTPVTSTSNEKGYYFVNLPPGTYTLTISDKGFKDFKTEGLALAADQEIEMGGTLEPAAATPEKVEVVGETVGQVETEKNEVNEVLTAKQVVETPLNGRNFTQLLTFAPGVSNQTGQDDALVGVKGSVKFSVNGGRVEYNTFSVDGTDVLHAGIHGSESTLVVYPSLDAINELKVLTSNYGAQYGRSASGTILVDTKSGGNTLHGSAYEFLRNEFFNARNYFDITQHAPTYRKHDFGGTIGGPVYIPYVYPHRDRTFFFFSEEFRLEHDPTDNNFNQAVPSAAERPHQITVDGQPVWVADFSDVCPAVPSGQVVNVIPFNPAKFPDCPQSSYGKTYPNNLVGYPFHNAAQFPPLSQVGMALVDSKMIPLPNATAGCNSPVGSCYDFAFSQPTFWREELFRIDHDIQPQKLRATFRYIHDSWDTTEARPIWGYVRNSFPTVQGRIFGPGTSATAHLTQTISPTLLNEFVVGYTASNINMNARPASGVNIARPACPGTDCLDQGFLFDNNFGGKLSGMEFLPGNLSYGGGFKVDAGYTPWELSNPTWSFRDDIFKGIGKHAVQFGLQVILGQRNEINATNGPNTGALQGVLTFGAQGTTSNEFADMLIGNTIQSFQQDMAQLKYHNRYEIIEPYLQDDWKVNSRLTLNLGIRFSLFGNYHENNEQAWNWDPNKYVAPGKGFKISPQGQMLFKGKPIPIDTTDPNFIRYGLNGLVECGTTASGVPPTCMKSHWFNPAPRVGFAFDPSGDHRTSIRGGYGVFFEHGTGSEANTGSLVGSAPLNLTMTQLFPTALPGQPGYQCIGGSSKANCISGRGAYPIDVTSIPRQAVWPYVQQWSFGVQRELAHSLVIGLGYVGSKGTHLTAVRQPNALSPAPQEQSQGILLNGNPYGPNQPILTNAQLFPDINTSCINSGTLNNPVFSVNGIPINKTQPAFLNLLAACEQFAHGSILPINAYRPFLGIQKIFSLENVADSNYHAFQATLRRTRGPLTVDASYSYSHSIDDSSDRNDTTIVNPLVVAANKASSNFDQRHLLNVSYVWTLPTWKVDSNRLKSWARDESREEPATAMSPSWFDRTATAVISGWQLSGVATVQSGIPYTVINGGDGTLGISLPDNAGVASGISSVASFPDLVGNPRTAAPIGADNPKSFGPAIGNAAAFAAPRGLTFGTAGRNGMNNPRRWNFDMTLFRNMKVHESTSLEFRFEVFNIFNHTQFRVYDPSPNFGNTGSNTISCYGIEQFSAAGDPQTDCLTGNGFLHPVNAHRPRTMQLGLKLTF